MSETGWVAIIVAALSLLGTLAGYKIQAQKNKDETIAAIQKEISQIQKESQETDKDMLAHFMLLKQNVSTQIGTVHDEISTLRTAVEKHNTVVERMYNLENHQKLTDEKLTNLAERIKEM